MDGFWSDLPRDDRDFFIALAVCTIAYGTLIWALSFVPTPQPSATDVRSLPPRIAKLILEAPPPPQSARTLPTPPPTLPGDAVEPVPKPSTEEPPSKPAVEPEPTPEAVPPPQPQVSEAERAARAEAALREARLRMEAEAAARRERDRTVARESGLLKALTESGGAGAGSAPALDRALHDVSVLSNPSLPTNGSAGSGTGLGTGSGAGIGSGAGGDRLRVEDLVGSLKGEGTGEAVVLAGKSAAAINSGLDVEKELLAKRSDASIYRMLKTLDPWFKLRYHGALKEEPNLGDFLSVRFTITAGGDVIGCAVQESRLNYRPLEEAILARICLLKFPPLSGGIGEVIDATYTIDFADFS